MTVFDIGTQRMRSLQRTRQAIEEMETVLERTASDSPSRGLVEGVLKRLKSTREKLAAGIHHDCPPL